MAPTEKPVQCFRVGHISAIVRTTTIYGGDWFTVEVTRSCAEFEAYQDPLAFCLKDLPFVAQAAIMAYDWIWRQGLPAQPDPELEGKPNSSGRMSRWPSRRNGPCV